MAQKFDSTSQRDNKSALEQARKFRILIFNGSRISPKEYVCFEKYDYDLKAALAAQKCSPLTYESEFKSVNILESIFGLRPNWRRMKSILKHGSCWSLKELPLPDRLKDLEKALVFGNLKGAESNPVILKDLVKKDVTYGYGLVLPLDKIKRIPGALLAPMNVMKQNSIDEYGRIVEKIDSHMIKAANGALVPQ